MPRCPMESTASRITAESLDQEEEIFFLSLACRRLEFLLGYVLYQHNIRYSGNASDKKNISSS
jgi:hypothetical protein